MRTDNIAHKDVTRRVVSVALFAVFVLLVAGCDSGLTSANERVRLVITPVPTPTQTPPAQPTAAPVTYVVQSGDTLWGIANLFGVTVDDIVRANNIADPSALAEGQVLTIPMRSPTGTPSAEGTAQAPAAGPTQTPGTPGAASTPSPTMPPPEATPPQGPDVPDPGT